MEYKVVWIIEVEATTPEEAAKNAHKIQKDFFSTATVFEVTDNKGKTVTVDLEELIDPEFEGDEQKTYLGAMANHNPDKEQ